MRWATVPILLLALALTGCFGPYAADLEPPKGNRPGADTTTHWTFGEGHSGDRPGIDAANVTTSFRLTGWNGAEPNLGVTESGAIFVTSFDYTLRTQNGLDWEEVYEFAPNAKQGSNTADPMLWVDPWTDRVYTSHMYPALLCMALAWSEDDGESWTENPASCTLPGLDHQKFFSAPPGPLAPAIAGDAHPTVLYQCYQRVVGTDVTGPVLAGFATFCNMSYDGGETWPAETAAAVKPPGLPIGCGGINGHPAPAADGTVLVPLTRGCDGLYVSASLDSGLTWTIRPGPTSVGAQSIDPDLAFTPDGTLFALWRGDDQRAYLARSGDLGVTWSGPWDVTPAHLTATVFQAISAGDDGRIAMTYLGSETAQGDPSFAGENDTWNLYAVVSENAADDAPTFDAFQVTPSSHPVQKGCVWLYGGGNPCRNMLDFIDSVKGPDGRFYVAYTDGCPTQPCQFESRTAVAILDGWSLHAS